MALSAASFFALSSSGCDGGGGSGGGDGGGGSSGDATCFDYSKFDGTSPEVSFKADVLPIFQRSCGLTTGCHGDPNQANEDRPYLGPNMKDEATDMDIAIIRGAIIDVPAYYEGSMAIVKPGEPENSFLMYKMDFQLTCDKLTCAEGKECGTSMPQGNSKPLPQEERDLVRRWIAQGALDN